MSPGQVRSRFEAIRRMGCTVLTLREAVTRLYDGTLPERAVAITVDDGAHDFRVRIVPLLEEFRYPATVYVSSYYTRKRLPVFDTMLRYLAWKAPSVRVPAQGLGGLETLDLTTTAGRRTASAALATHAADRGLDADEKESLLTTFAERTGVDYARLKALGVLHLMDEADFASLPAPLVSVQLHTHRHRVPVERDAFMREVTENREALAGFGFDPSGLVDFCYPSGVTHERFPGWLAECGVQTATTCRVALATPEDPPLLLPRFIDTGHCSEVEFEAWLTGTAEFAPRRRDVPTAGEVG